MTFDFDNSLKKVSDFVQAGKGAKTSFRVPSKICSLVPEFVHTVSTVVCEEKNIQKLLEDLNVLINTEYLINVNDLNIETKYQGIVSLTEKVVNVIIERGSCGHDSSSVDKYGNTQKFEKQILCLFELLPSLFYCLVNIENQIEDLTKQNDFLPDAKIKKNCSLNFCLSKIVKKPWKPNFFLPTMLLLEEMKFFLDFNATQSLSQLILSANIAQDDYPAVFKCVLNFIASTSCKSVDVSDIWINLFRNLLFRSIQNAVSADVFLICKIAMEQSPVLCKRIIRYYLRCSGRRSKKVPKFSWTDPAVIFLVSHNFSENDCLVSLLTSIKSQQQRYLEGFVMQNDFEVSKILQSRKRRIKLHQSMNRGLYEASTDDLGLQGIPMVWLCRQCLTSILICFADIPNRQSPRENILELCSKLLHDGKQNLGTDFLVCIIPGLIDLCTALMSLKTEAFRMQSITDDMKIRKDFQSVASDLLFSIFQLHPQCESSIIDTIFHHLLSKGDEEIPTKLAHRAYLQLLSRISTEVPAILSKHTHKVQDLLTFIFGPSVGYCDAKGILISVMPLVKLSKDFADFIMLRLRKITLNKRSGSKHYLAIDGLCSFLQYTSLMEDNVHTDIVDIIRSIMFISLELRMRILRSIGFCMEKLLNMRLLSRRIITEMDFKPFVPINSAGLSAMAPVSSSSASSSSSFNQSSGSVEHDKLVRAPNTLPLCQKSMRRLSEFLWQRLIALCSQSIVGNKNKRTKMLLGDKLSLGHLSHGTSIKLTLDWQRMFRVLQVNSRKIYEQVESPSSLFSCLVSLIRLQKARVLDLNPITKACMSILCLDESEYDNLDDEEAIGLKKRRIDQNGSLNFSRSTVPLVDRARIVVPLCSALSQLFYSSIHERNEVSSNGESSLNNKYMDLFFEKLDPNVLTNYIGQCYSLAGTVSIICQSKYDMGAVTRGELIEFFENGELNRPIESLEVQTSVFILKKFSIIYAGSDSTKSCPTDISSPPPTISITAALHAAKHLLQWANVWKTENIVPQHKKHEKCVMNMFSTLLDVYAATSLTIVNKDGSHYIAFKNLLLKSYKQKRDLFADIICRFVQSNVHQEQEIANLPYLKLLLLPSTARSSFMKSLLMKDTGVSTIFFELRIAILEIINSILSVHGSSLLCKANEKSILKFASTMSSHDGTNLMKTMMHGKSANVNICLLLGATFGKQIPRDMETTLGTHPALISLNIAIMKRCIEITTTNCVGLYKAVVPEFVNVICNFKIDKTKVLKEILEFTLVGGYALCEDSLNEVPDSLPSAMIRSSIKIQDENSAVRKGSSISKDSYTVYQALVDQIKCCSFETIEGSKATLLVPFQHHLHRLKVLVSGKDNRIVKLNDAFRKKYVREKKNNDQISTSVVSDKLHQLIDGAGASDQILHMEERLSALQSIRIILEDCAHILCHDTIKDAYDLIIRLKGNEVQKSKYFEITFSALKQECWKPKLLQKSYSHILPVQQLLFTLGRNVCQVIMRYGYRPVHFGTGSKAEQLSIWPILSHLHRLSLISRRWIEAILRHHSHIKKKCSETLMAIEKFDMEIWNMCISHEQYIYSDNGDIVVNDKKYHTEFVSVVVDVLQNQRSVLKMTKSSQGRRNRSQLTSSRAKRGRRKKRLRSRNAYVDTHLENESGNDAYADLEDFIVGDDEDID